MHLLLIISLLVLGQSLAQLAGSAPESGHRLKSAYFAFVDREYIFTIEVVRPGVPIFNFVSMSEEDNTIFAKDIQLTLENQKASGRLFMVDTADPKEPMVMASLRMRARSSFGVRLDGDFGTAGELLGAAVRFGDQNFRLVPLTSFDFEKLAVKINSLNLGSPDFRDDWRVLKLEVLGKRTRIR